MRLSRDLRLVSGRSGNTSCRMAVEKGSLLPLALTVGPLCAPKGFTMTKNFDFGKCREVVTILNGALPEVLRRVFIIGAPIVFQVTLADAPGTRAELPGKSLLSREALPPSRMGGAR